MLKVEGHSGLVRDPHTKAILNVDVGERDKFINQKRRKRELEERLNNIERKYDELNSTLNKILTLLQK